MGVGLTGCLVGNPVRSLNVGGTLWFLRVSIIGRGDVPKYPSGRVPTFRDGRQCLWDYWWIDWHQSVLGIHLCIQHTTNSSDCPSSKPSKQFVFLNRLSNAGQSIEGCSTGIISGAFIDPVSHKILYEVGQGHTGSTTLLGKNKQAFAQGWSVNYPQAGSSGNDNSLCAQVLFCQVESNKDSTSSPCFSYTIMTFSNDQNDGFQVAQHVLSDEVRYNATSTTAAAATYIAWVEVIQHSIEKHSICIYYWRGLETASSGATS